VFVTLAVDIIIRLVDIIIRLVDIIIRSFPQLMKGLAVTIGLTLTSVFIASILAIIMAIGRCFSRQPIPFLILIYEKVFRGIPLLVIFILIYFGLAQIGIVIDVFIAAVIGLALHSTAYQIQIFRSAINSIPEGQLIAAKSLGMTNFNAMRYIILPQMLRLSIPGWSNEFTIVLKDTSITIAIGVIDLMRQGKYIIVREPSSALYILLFIALIYFILVFSINRGLSYLEKRYVISGLEVSTTR
jgi:polar amino acid transport system permease protein